jgi:hypothetical protein
MKRHPALVLVLCTLGTGPFVHAGPTAGPEDLLPFKQALMGALQAGLAEGPVAAVTACNLIAPGLPAAQAERGFEVGRASDRLRNPHNTAPAWVAPVLDGMLAGMRPIEGRAVWLDDGRTGWVEPIRIGPMCLQCHGDAIDEEVAAALDARYPEDRARGYAAGDLRGVFWIVPTER